MMKRLFFTLILLSAALLTTKLLFAQTQPAKPEPQTFAILYEPGPNWIKGKPIFEQDLQEHGQYMAKLLDQGHLELGGPFTDSSGGLVIITAKDNDEATVIMKHDPGITKGVFKATLRPWYVVFRKHETVAPKSPATTMPTQSWTGIAASRMVGAYLQGPNIYVAFPRDRWPDDAEGKRVTVTGLPVERHDLPVFIPKEGEVQIQGIPMPEGTDLYKASARIVIEQAKWSVVSDGR